MLTLPNYQLLYCLREGTLSNIYRAIRLSDKQQVVIKVSTQKAVTEKKAQRFRREFEISRKIDSPHVIRYLEFMQDKAYGIALVIEDNNALELASVIPEQGFSNEEFLKIAPQIVQGLQKIHEANIIHNDLKPSNILIQPTTRHIKIIDFNRASSLRQEIQPPISTRLEVGTLAYISPEQTGRINRSIDYRTDFYSLGVTFYRLLCGQLPFIATDALGLIHQHLAKQPTPPHHIKPTIALALSQMVMKLLEKEAENRYQSCEGILYDLTKCLTALQESGTIPTFELGQQDFSPRFTLSQHLYGRENETNMLIKVVTRVSQGSREVVMVTGQPGVGKSILIQELQKPITTMQNGYFITGKFDLLSKNVAYSALTQAFEGLIKQLLTEDEASIIRWKNQLLTALGSQAQLMIQMVPTLTLLIGEQPPAQIANSSQAKTILNLVFLEFIKVFTDAAHPLVLFLDDLQWADNASLELMTNLLQQPQVKHLLWVGAYRDTEVTSSHPALQAIATLQEARVNIQTLTLKPLGLESLQQWISDSLHMSLVDIAPLAELIQQKTDGNPFFVKLFLQALYDQQLLSLSSNNRWQWDLDNIRKHPATENVITLMTYQIKQLSPDTQNALSIASCLGHRLILNTLQIVMGDYSAELIYDVLRPAFNSGILISTDSEMQFAHDRVQEAAYSLLADKARMHLTIGQRLLPLLEAEETWLFDIVAQFNRSRSLITEPQECLRFARLNLKAGQKAKQATAYTAALTYLDAVQDWVDTKNLWHIDYALAFTFHKELAEVEYLCGQVDISQTLIANMHSHLQSNLDKVEIYHLLIIQKILQGEQQGAISLGHQALQLLGSGLPLDNPHEYVQREMPLLKQKLADRPVSSLLDAPLASDPEKQAIFKILAALSSACYQIGSKLLPATTLMSINLSLNYGHVPESCVGYVVYGLLLCTEYQDYALGYAFGDLAIRLAEKLHSPVQRCRSALFMLDFIHAWSKPIKDLPTMFATALEESLACGEIEYAGYCGDAKVHMLFDQGANLAKVQQQIKANLQFAQSTKTKGVIYNVMRGYQKVIANLTGETQNENDFNYQNVSELEFEQECQKSASGMALGLYYIRKAQALYVYGHAEQALQQLDLARNKLSCMLGFYAVAVFNWYDSLARLALYSTASSEVQQTYLEQINQNQQQMQRWQASCPENFAHKYCLVEAELARIKGDHKQAETSYDQAITLAGRNGFAQEQAVAAERATKYWRERGKFRFAQGDVITAFNSYKQWGAKRKLALLKAQYFDELQALAPHDLSQLVINQETTFSSNTLKGLDLSGILRASHIISREIELPKLLHNIMQLIIEIAGAQQGTLLFVEADESIFVQAEYALNGTISTLQKIPLTEWSNGASAVIYYVKRLHQHVVVDDAITHELFKSDPYISRTQAKSILCIPVLQHMELKAILYAENKLMSYAFTPERVQTVLILTAQMAISLENARYFAEQLALTRQLAEQSTRTQMAEASLSAVTHDLQLALEASKAGTWNWQIDTNNVTWDATNYALFGITPSEFDGTYAAVLERVHPEDRERLGQDVKRCIEQDTLHDMEYRVIWPDGSQHVISGKGRVYRNEKGQPLKMTGVCIDVTQRKQLEEERLQALRQAEEKEHRRAEEAEKHRKEQEIFIDTVCHEIRNPMIGIYGSADFLKQMAESLKTLKVTLLPDTQPTVDELLSKLQESINILEQCVGHQKTIIDDVLDLSKLEAGKVELVLKPFQPKNLVENTLQIYTTPIATKNLALHLLLPEQAITVQGDPDHFNIILMNLISNAIKFTEHGHIKVSLQTQMISPIHVALTLSVEDTGVGMTQEQQSRLFQRFSRPVSSQYEGSGLGLTITKKLIDLMGGTIQVESEHGRGSRFTVHFVCESVVLELRSSPLISKQPATPQPAAFLSVPKQILVVEDNKVNQLILTKQLGEAGYQFKVANNGQEAVEKCQQVAFDLILMDIEMPIMDGLEATKRIRRWEKDLNRIPIPIIGLTAYARDERMEKGIAAGMNTYLTKPYKKDQLLSTIKQLTEQGVLPETKVAVKTAMHTPVLTERLSLPPTETGQGEADISKTPSSILIDELILRCLQFIETHKEHSKNLLLKIDQLKELKLFFQSQAKLSPSKKTQSPETELSGPNKRRKTSTEFFKLPSVKKSESPLTDRSYWYSDSDINKLLNLLVKDNQDANILLAPNNDEMFIENLQRAIGSYKPKENEQGSVNPKLPSLLPLNINFGTQKIENRDNNHWVGLYIKPKSDFTYDIDYVDSKGFPIPDFIRAQIESVLIKKLGTISSKSKLQQSNPNDCGAFLIDNFDNLFHGRDIQVPLNFNADHLRQKHAELLSPSALILS